MQPQPKEYLEPPEARRGREASLLELPEEVQPCQQFEFSLLASLTMAE